MWLGRAKVWLGGQRHTNVARGGQRCGLGGKGLPNVARGGAKVWLGGGKGVPYIF